MVILIPFDSLGKMSTDKQNNEHYSYTCKIYTWSEITQTCIQVRKINQPMNKLKIAIKSYA